MSSQTTAPCRAVAAVPAARAARRHLIRIAVIARQLDQIAPGTARVLAVPALTEDGGAPRRATWVALDDVLGQPVNADRAAHRAALGLIRRMHPDADWARPLAYDALTGAFTVIAADALPEELS